MSESFSPLAEKLDDTITLSSSGTYGLGSIGIGATYANSVSATSYPYTISTGITQPWATRVAPKIKLDGKGADIEVNGWSLMDAIQKIEERLNIMHPNEKLEAEWAELRVLGEQYRKLEQHIKDKQATWDKLKAMPRRDIE
jgi:hypothetical protein